MQESLRGGGEGRGPWIKSTAVAKSVLVQQYSESFWKSPSLPTARSSNGLYFRTLEGNGMSISKKNVLNKETQSKLLTFHRKFFLQAWSERMGRM